tara:strand:- start:362 stop:508 length:147 start_codon:yes stop_codon:yes gene_type:complete
VQTELLAAAILAAALIGKSGMSYFFTTSGVINKQSTGRLKELVKALQP